MMRRAHEMNDRAVDVSMLERALAREPEDGSPSPPVEAKGESTGLDVFVRDARQAADKAVTVRRRRARARRSSRVGGVLRWALPAVAAVALVGLGFGIARSRRSTTAERPLLHKAVLSVDVAAAAAAAAVTKVERPSAANPDTAPPGSVPAAEPSPATSVPSSEAPRVRGRPRARVRRDVHGDEPDATAPPPATSAPDPLRELDRAAQAAWRRGELEQATALFEQVIAAGPGTAWAHLAYGDLFALARQRNRPQLEESRWKEYLDAYPKGPHADDAQAGLCRRAAADERGVCWRSYLDTYPKGVHRRRAVRALESISDAPE